MELLFVYGTLRRHGVNHTVLEYAKCKYKQAWTTGKLYNTGRRYPAFIQTNDGNNMVYGELYEVTKQQLFTLDVQLKVEDNGSESMYIRKKQRIYTENGSVIAHIYLYNLSCCYNYPIPHGDWKFQFFLNKTEEHFYFFDYETCSSLSDHPNKMIGYAKDYLVDVTSGYVHLKELENSLMEGTLIQLPCEMLSKLLEYYKFFQNVYRPTFLDVMIDDELYKDVLTFVLTESVLVLSPSFPKVSS